MRQTIESTRLSPIHTGTAKPLEASTSPIVVEVVSASELMGPMADRWEAMRASSAALASPFFSSRFANVVGNLRPEAKIAVVFRDETIVGFLPFEFASRSVLDPIGKAFNDAHGILCDPNAPLNYCHVLDSLGAKMYRFHALAGPVTPESHFIFGTSPSFLANLESHPEGYVQFLLSRRATIQKQERKTRKMIRDLGPVRLELDCRDPSVLSRLIALKRDQYQRTFIFDILGVPWAQEMLRELWFDPKQSCRGLLSVLYAGDTLVAAHYGMLEGGILHYWFPAYESRFHQYSPGTAMFLEIALQAPSIGIRKIDLGYGEQPYKHKFVDTLTQMPYGAVSNCRLSMLRERMRLMLSSSAKRIPGKPLLKRIVRRAWPNFGAQPFR